MQINLKNNNVMVKEVVRKEEEKVTAGGIFLPEETLEEEQVSQGLVVKTNSEEFPVGCTILFHKTLPVDVNMKLEGDEALSTYYFINIKDIICSITE